MRQYFRDWISTNGFWLYVWVGFGAKSFNLLLNSLKALNSKFAHHLRLTQNLYYLQELFCISINSCHTQSYSVLCKYHNKVTC